MKIKDKHLYYIGGIVRDELLGQKSFDVDLTYEGDAIEFAKTIQGAQIKQINEKFGTVRILLNGEEIDIASTRNERYPRKGHLPEVFDIGCNLKEDVMRRDFTINALAKSTYDGHIIDYTGGLEDIKNKKLCILHDNSFSDDPTRIVRALKFSVRFEFELEEHTRQLQEKYLENINYDMSYKRLQKELKETFNLNKAEAFKKFINQGIYKLISPEKFQKADVKTLELLINKYKPENIWIIYIGLLPDISALPLTKTEKRIVLDYRSLFQKPFNNDFEIFKNFEGVRLESIIMFALQNEDIVTKYLDKLSKIRLSISGKDLQKLGIKPGGKYNECFDFILKKKLGKPELTLEDEIRLAGEFFK